MEKPEIVIVGAGIAGASMAIVLARRGLSVLLLEKSSVFVDRIRGEGIVAWGVAEAKQIGILDLLVAAGAVYVRRTVAYSEEVSPDVAEARAIPIDQQVPGVQGNLDIGHPQMCQALTEAASSAGARLLRGVSDVRVSPGMPPVITFVHEGERLEIKPRLIIGADGRGSAIASQIGAKVESDPLHHLMAGLLIDPVHDWQTRDMSIGTEGDITFFIVPLAQRTRLYLCYGLENRRRFAGPDAAKNFLNAFRLKCLPHRESFAGAIPAGPCGGYPNADTWIDEPMKPGVVLIGDAAGHNDPAIGQGLSLAFRDVRLVAEALEGNTEWTQETFRMPAKGGSACAACARMLKNFRGFAANTRKRRAHGGKSRILA
jgi:2-polyprenyl-6-methoxyphenol hydroxylase-like FAD-dependent oxidoreductase